MIQVYKATAPGMKARLGNGKDHPAMGLNITKEANCAKNGWHCAENPLDCLSFFSWDGKNEFYLCEAGGDIHESGHASVISCTELTVLKRLDLVEFVAAAVKYVIMHPRRPLHHLITESVTVSTKDFFGIAYGRHPSACGDTGTVLGLIRTDESGNITAVHIEKVGSKKIRPKVTYTVNDLGLLVRKGGVKMTDEFATLPPVSEKAKEEMADGFDHYLFFETIKKGCRRYTCSACKKTFERGEAVPLRTVTYNDAILYHAKHNSYQKCPLCGVKAEVKNLKICNRSTLAQYDHVAVFLANGHDDVWVRCFNYWKEYHIVTAGQQGMTEVMRYHLQPGKAEFWVRCSATDNGWLKQKIFGEAFLWNHGLWTEKYPWYSYEDNMSISETFLKYHSFGDYKYHGNDGGGVSAMKYMCWYAVHPQIEMLVKLGHYKTVDEMVIHNTDNRSILNWNAKKPWDLYMLPKNIYNEWRNKYYGDMKILKTYKAFGGSSVKDLKLADTVLDFNHQSLRAAKRMGSLARRYGTTIKEIISYCEKVSARSGGGCWHCPGITSVEAFNMWCDYLDMAHGAKADKNLVIFPSDLKAAHDAFIITANFRKNELTMKQMKAHAEKRAEELRKKFPTVKKIYSRLQSKYAYTNGEYAVVVPKGIEDIVLDGLVLGHCTERTERYYDRIASKESYILFLRKDDSPDVPWYTLEAEPNGTLRQKRTNGDVQLADLNEAIPFLKEWQMVVAERITKADKALAKKSAQLRKEGYAELRETKTIIHYGEFAGKLLADILEKDLMETTA